MARGGAASKGPGEAATAEGATGSGRAAPAAGGGGGPSDAECVARSRRGDHAAFRVLVERYQGRAFGLALRVLRDEEQARDVVQDALLKAYGSLDRFEERAAFYTWLHRIVMNLCLDRKRREKTARRVDFDDAAESEIEARGALEAAPEALEQVERGELREQLARAIATLPPDARRTLELREIDELSYEEIARTLGVPKGTVMSRLHYARRRVRDALVAAGAVESSTPRGGEGREESR